MATNYIPSGEELSFELQTAQIKTQIETYFLEMSNFVKERERELLKELEDIHNKYKLENEKQRRSISEIEKALKFNREHFTTLRLEKTQTRTIKLLEEELREIELEYISKLNISIEFDNTLLDSIKCIGKISVVNSNICCQPVVDYVGKAEPVVSVGGVSGGEEGQFRSPWGVAVDYRTNNIYVADKSNNRVQTFNEYGKYLFKFGDEAEECKMNSPLGIAITNQKVFVSQTEAGCLMVFDLNGKFIKQIGNKGIEKGQFSFPRGIAVNDTNGDIFVSDYGNKRIQIFSEKYSYKSKIALYRYPSDIKLTNDEIYVLSHQHPFLFCFNYNLSQVSNTISNSVHKHLDCPFGFLIDSSGNFIISDHGIKSILIIDIQANILHKITSVITGPRGVALDAKGRIIVAGNNHLIVF
ncbi:E3 ubiquitin-protein ligase TRIM71 isoform X3 [Oopsacas minuta]|uniref:E3 ubiquitin-protein ligase TRIM71 isoform X3 n=1 Tax=Oopsacas minuta TaxID=111878 RepID=A0AAV7K309_9METZ|nr:E3 ubiquitin-protein ligase TRIM71 isoform X3 [Oopsacas minuta]